MSLEARLEEVPKSYFRRTARSHLSLCWRLFFRSSPLSGSRLLFGSRLLSRSSLLPLALSLILSGMPAVFAETAVPSGASTSARHTANDSSIPVEAIGTGTGHFVHIGQVQLADSNNRGDIANFGFVVGTRCVAVIDTGNSRHLADGLRAAIRERTPLPVCYVVLTHMHPDHVFGVSAWRESPGPVIVGHRNLPAALTARAAGYRDALVHELGEDAAGSQLVMPDELVDGERRIDIGGKVLVLKAWPTAHTNNDLSVLDPVAGVIWLGDLAFVEHLPVVDGSLMGWLGVLDALKSIDVRHVVPGHGTVVAGPMSKAVDPVRAYLQRLASAVRRQIADNVPLSQAQTSLDSVAVPPPGSADASGWKLVEQFHRRNVAAAYAELEWE